MMDMSVSLDALREYARKELVDLLNEMRGGKVLVLDRQFAAALGLFAEIQLLKDHGVEKLYYLEGEFEVTCQNVIFMVRPQLHLMERIGKVIDFHRRKGARKDYSIIFVPHRTVICEHVLQEQGFLMPNVTLYDYQLDLIPYDADLLSMELNHSFSDLNLKGDHTVLYRIACGIAKLQNLYGIIPHIKGKGEHAKSVADMIIKLRRESFADGEEAVIVPEIDQLILIDRQVDLVSPICTPLTYEGLIDELFGIKCGQVEVELENAADDAAPAEDGETEGLKKVTQTLNSSDKLYHEVRDMYFMNLGPNLTKIGMDIKRTYEERGNMRQKSTGEMKEFVRKLNVLKEDHRSLEFHTNLAKKIEAITHDPEFRSRIHVEQGLLLGHMEEANEYLEMAINKQEPLKRILRLLCLKSLCSNGIPKKELDFFRRELLHSYGYEAIMTLMNLEKLGMFRQPSDSAPGNWKSIKQAFRLIVDDIDEKNPQDIAYTHCMYAPLSVRLVERAARNLWSDPATRKALAQLPGPTVEIRQEGTVPIPHGANRRPVSLVFYIGGCTFAEITALRFMGESIGHEFIIATTKLINGDSLIDSVIEMDGVHIV